MARSPDGSVSILAVDGPPRGGGRSWVVLQAILASAESAVAVIRIVSLSDHQIAPTAESTAGFDAFVLGAPALCAAPASPLKAFLDAVPRETSGQFDSPFRAKPFAIAMTGSTHHHYLALDGLRNVLANFLAAHVLSPGLYVAVDGFVDRELEIAAEQLARAQGVALVALSSAIRSSPALRTVRPQI